jgi:hypothetical protein
MFAIKTYASLDGTGTPLSVQNVVASIAAGRVNPLTLTLDGVLASFSIALSQSVLPAGQSASVNVVVNALDASGNTIVGPGVFSDANGNPIAITLTDSDTTGATQLGSTTLTQPATIPLTYNGATGLGTIAITASAAGFASKTVDLSITALGVTLTDAQVQAAVANVQATFATMPHVNEVDDLNALATAMVQSGAFQYAAQTPGGISAILSDGTPLLVFADHPEELGYPISAPAAAPAAAAAKSTIARARHALGSSRTPFGLTPSTPVPGASPTPMPTVEPAPGGQTGHEIAFLVNTTDTGGAFTPSRQAAFGAAFTASGFTAKTGYNVDVLPITLGNIALGENHPLDYLNLATHGIVFAYTPQPGVTLPPTFATNNYANLSDSTYTLAARAAYQADFNAGNLVAGVQLAFGAGTGTLPQIAFTPGFLVSRMTFNPGALVVNSSCWGQNPLVASAVTSTLNGAGVGRYIGWTKEVNGTDADETDAFLYDRLLGEQTPSVTGLEHYVTPRTPAQRPFPLDAIDTVEMTEIRNGPITRAAEPYANSDVQAPVNAKAPPLQDGTLARLLVSDFGGEELANAPISYGLPTIQTMNVFEGPTNGALTISGNFPMNPGTVTVTDSNGTLTLIPTAWSQTTVTATIPASGAQSAGMVQVLSAEGIASNAVPLTQWSGTLTYTENDSLINLGSTTGSGSGTVGVRYALTFRSDVHPTVPTIDTSPVPQNFTFLNPEGNSTATVTSYAGQYQSSDGKVIATYALSPTTPQLSPTFPPLGSGNFEVRPFFEGTQPSPCNNGAPGPEGDAGNVFCPITGFYIPDGSITCSDSGDDSGCPGITTLDQVGSYGATYDAGGILSMTMDPATYAVTVSGTTTQYTTNHFGAYSGANLDPATASMSGTIQAPTYAPTTKGTSLRGRSPRSARPVVPYPRR